MALIGEMQYLTIGGNTYSLPSGGGGSVTSVAVSNATNGGLSVSGSPISSSGTITIGHSNVLAAAQTTQAVYPIKIDKNGHISGYGSAVTISDTKNTAGSTDSNSKLFLIGATSQAANPQTYSHDTAYVGTDGYLYSNSKKTLVEQYSNNGYNLNITPSVSSSSADFTVQAALDNSGNFYETLYFGSDGFYISNDIDEKTWIHIDNSGTTPVSITGVKTPQEQYDAVNKKYVDDSINALDGSITGTAGAGKTLTAFSQTNGKVTATFGNISITKSQISDFPTIPTVPSDIVNTITTTAGTHTAISSKTGAVSFNVPTKTSHLTNDSGFITDVQVDGTSVVTGGVAEINSEIFVVNLISTEGTYTSDKTVSEIIAAYNNGKTVVAKDTSFNTVYFVGDIDIQNSTVYFERVTFNDSYNLRDPVYLENNYFYIDSNGVDSGYYSFQVAYDLHTHGNITNTGDITTTATIASGDRLVINDESASKVNNSSITFGTSTSQYLANNGTWQNVPSVPTKTSDLTNDSGFLTSYTETDPVFSASAAAGITSSNISTWNNKQAALVSGTNIKTINNQSILGSGNITVSTTAAQIIRWTET